MSAPVRPPPPKRTAASQAAPPTLRLDRDRSGFLIVAGFLDVFARSADGPPRPLFRLQEGEAVFGLGSLADVEVLARPGDGAKLRAIGSSAQPSLADAWRARLAETLGEPCDGEAVEPVLSRWLDARAAADGRRTQARLGCNAMAASGLLDRVGHLAGAVAGPRGSAPQPAADPMLAACQAVAAGLGAGGLRRPKSSSARDRFGEAREIARTAGLRTRRTMLRPGWRHADAGPVLAWVGETGAPVALVATAAGYAVFDPVTGVQRPVDEALARSLSPEALCFYRALPDGRRSVQRLAHWLAPMVGRDLRRVLGAGLGAALVGLVAPIVTGLVIDQAILPSDPGVLLACALALVAAALGAAAFAILQSIATLRLSAGADATLQAAVVDHLLRLPSVFFRGYSAGDLVDRLSGVEVVRQALSGRVVGAVLAGGFCMAGVVLMFVLDVRLAVAATMLGVLQLAVTVALVRRRLTYERGHAHASGLARGLVLQILAGVAKLRVAAAGGRALLQWFERFSAQVALGVRARGTEAALTTFNATFPVAATLIVFALAGANGVSPARLLAFYAAFGQVTATLIALGMALSDVAAAAPRAERLAPVLAAAPEAERSDGDAPVLAGAVELKDVVFRYDAGEPPVIDGVSLRAAPGEFVAVVGPSGGGKSTLMRLLLGFERPQSGSVLFDGRSIEALDLALLRRQIGVALQDGRLISGSLYENICGAAVLPVEQVWTAVRQAGLAADIEAMPMGLHTFVSEGAGAISGGQRQRLLIARALVRQPRLLLFDEATSALDNRTQAVVGAALAEVAVTRIVIAHRLSTIRDADRIVVIDRGQVVQEGAYADLIRTPGLFANLAKRQI